VFLLALVLLIAALAGAALALVYVQLPIYLIHQLSARGPHGRRPRSSEYRTGL
jgi:hypothetical protein